MMKLRALFPKDAPQGMIAAAGRSIAREADKDRTIDVLSRALNEYRSEDARQAMLMQERDNELEEALAMRGAGPWRLPMAEDGGPPVPIRESSAPGFAAQGAYGDTELMLQNVGWRRETNLSWLEFSRWGIQQIILISRLRCMKDPMLQRGMNVSAQYVFGRGVEITSPDPDVADALKEWREENEVTLGQVALAELERSKYHDGNVFFVCFPDKENTGSVKVRTIDPLEVSEIITDPDDTATPWLYRREWIARVPRDDGSYEAVGRKAYYPAMGYEPADQPPTIGGIECFWNSPVLHRKCNAPGKWHFGLPVVYAALGYAKAVQKFLEDCMTIRNSLAQFSMTLTTKGGQQAMQGAKTQLSTTVGPNASLWDQNPTAVAGSIFTSGPGTELSAFNTKGAGGDPGEVREYKLQVAMVFGLPESFFSDMNTSNLATATSLDRPTELNFVEKQAVWAEDLKKLARYALQVSMSAPSGKLRESAKGKPKVFDVQVNFPTIIEADVPAQIGAVVDAMTLGNSQGEVVGIDEKEGVRQLYQLIGTVNSEYLLEEQYPDSGPDAYDPKRKNEPEPAPAPAQPGAPAPNVTPTKESSRELRAAMSRLSQAFRIFEAAQHAGKH